MGFLRRFKRETATVSAARADDLERILLGQLEGAVDVQLEWDTDDGEARARGATFLDLDGNPTGGVMVPTEQDLRRRLEAYLAVEELSGSRLEASLRRVVAELTPKA